MSVTPPPKFFLLRVCEIIQHELELLEGTVFIYNQRINLSSFSGLLVAVGVQSLKMIGVRTQVLDGIETQGANVNAVFSIDIMSKDLTALDRKEEVILALSSTYAEQIQEKYGFHIGKLPTNFVNLSEIDGAAIPYRFQLSVQVQYAVNKTKSVDYFDQFSDSLTTGV